ncbi:hypothetical protein [Haloarcula sebkhae]|uniref:Uncharacterized protein n=2 Tax=Haloarcula sebkhae TaxID=932660 RepID=A0ACC6VM38_9EURY|nr:hypothetical protein [Haloarcula sebkhae]GGK84048.1 hypothetical protein GCM10009067_40350 [Haloarcula sebkhae]
MTEVSDQIRTELDKGSRDILSALAEFDSVAETADIKELTGLSNKQIHYRIENYLEHHGLVITEQPAGGPGPAPAKKIQLTQDGKEVIDTLNQEPSSGNVVDRLEQVERQVDTIQSTVQGLDSDSSSTGQTDVDNLQEQVANLAMEVEELKNDPIFDTEIRSNLDDCRAAILALTRVLDDRHGDQDRIRELTADYREDIKPLVD